jgi:glycyl-tRNA synthetase beta chain
LKQANFEFTLSLREALIEQGPERELYDEFQGSYGQPLELRIVTLRPKLDLFFDKVLVNAPDPELRRNRLALLYRIRQEFSDVADFSEIVTERQS